MKINITEGDRKIGELVKVNEKWELVKFADGSNEFVATYDNLDAAFESLDKYTVSMDILCRPAVERIKQAPKRGITAEDVGVLSLLEKIL